MIPIISVVIGIVAATLTAQFMKKKDIEVAKEIARVRTLLQKVEIMVASKDLPTGTRLTTENMKKRQVPKVGLKDDVLMAKDGTTVLGKKLRWSVKKHNLITWNDIEGSDKPHSGLSPIINKTKNLRAVSIAVSGSAAVSGMIQPNDHIDVLGTFTFASKTIPGEMESVTLTMLQDVTVLATGDRLAKPSTFERSRRSKRSSGYSTVTVEVTPQEAELLIFAQNAKGKLSLSLRHPDDVHYIKTLESVNFEHLEKRIPEYNTYRQREIRNNPRVR